MRRGEVLGKIRVVCVQHKCVWGLEWEGASMEKYGESPDVTAVFAVVDLSELLPDATIFDFFGGAFQNDGFVGFFRADHYMRVRSHILCFAGARGGAEPEGVLPPDSPNYYEIILAPGARRGARIVVAFFAGVGNPPPRPG